jgi:hypothetical protein
MLSSHLRHPGWVAGIIVLATLSPTKFDARNGLTIPGACAQVQGGTCCPEDRSVCFVNGVRVNDSYYLGTGKCAPPPDQ